MNSIEDTLLVLGTHSYSTSRRVHGDDKEAKDKKTTSLNATVPIKTSRFERHGRQCSKYDSVTENEHVHLMQQLSYGRFSAWQVFVCTRWVLHGCFAHEKGRWDLHSCFAHQNNAICPATKASSLGRHSVRCFPNCVRAAHFFASA